MAISKILFFLFLAFASTSWAAVDLLDQYVPLDAEVVPHEFVQLESLERLALVYVKSLEGRNRPALEAVVTKNFAETTKVFEGFDAYQTKLPLKKLELRDFLAIRHAGNLLIRFSVYDPGTKKTDEMNPRSWYELKKENGAWRIDGYRPDFEPDM